MRHIIDISLTIQYVISQRSNFVEYIALSASEISLMNSKLPLCGNVQVVVRSILYHFKIKWYNMLPNFFNTIFLPDISIWYCTDYWYLSLSVFPADNPPSYIWMCLSAYRISEWGGREGGGGISFQPHQTKVTFHVICPTWNSWFCRLKGVCWMLLSFNPFMPGDLHYKCCLGLRSFRE